MSTTAKNSNQTLCRNILIHGYCKYADKGCVFRHDSPASIPPSSKSSSGNKKKLNADSPSFTPSGFVSVSPNRGANKATPNFDVAPFVPKGFSNGSKPAFNPESSAFSPRAAQTPPPSNHPPSNQLHGPPPPFLNPAGSVPDPLMADFSTLSMEPPPPPPPPRPPPQSGPFPSSNPHTDLIYQHHSNYPLQYHLYAPSVLGARPRSSLAPHERTVQDFFISNGLREEMQRKNEATLQTLPNSNLPEYVHVYHSLVPLDTNFEENERVFGYPTWVYKAVSSSDGLTYCLRRIEGFRLTNEKAIHSVRQWNKLESPSIVKLYEAFTTHAFGDNSLIFVYDYYPLAATLFETHFGPNGFSQGSLVEEVLWSYIVQIVLALQTIHEAGLAAGIVDPTRVILTKKGRLRLNCCGIFDILNFDQRDSIDVGSLQQQDLVNLGRLMIALACNSVSAAVDVDKSLYQVSKVYSPELHDFLAHIVSSQVKETSELVSRLSARIADCFNSSLYYNDSLDAELSKELENGRLVRLLCKLGFINERPAFDHDSAWSETGDRYIIKLFRDYVFHQVDSNGKPVLDLGHVLMALNKLDAGIDENIVLVSRDEQNCLIVSYKELKACMEFAFRDLSR